MGCQTNAIAILHSKEFYKDRHAALEMNTDILLFPFSSLRCYFRLN